MPFPANDRARRWFAEANESHGRTVPTYYLALDIYRERTRALAMRVENLRDTIESTLTTDLGSSLADRVRKVLDDDSMDNTDD